jgi:hypothetical protein
MRKINQLLSVVIIASSLSSCQEEEVLAPLVIPTSYDATAFVANTTAEYELRTNFTNFINEVKKGRTSGTVVTAAKLTELFNAGSNSISKYAPNTIKTTLPILFAELEKSSKGKTYQFGKTPAENIDGGVNNAYLFDETGLELEQIIEKGSFNAVFYTKTLEYLATPTSVNLDKALALYGANPTFPNTPTASKTAQPDIWMANYGARRTKASGGLYTQVKDAFIKAQAALKAGEKYNTERDAAIAEILLKWEQINAATVINYLYAVETGLSTTNADDKTKATAMHAYGECIGFLSGFKGVSKKKISETQIDDILSKLNYSAPYNLIGSVSEIAKLAQVRKELQAIYGFTDTQMEEFKSNWISVEAR